MLIELENVGIAFGERPVLDGVSMQVDDGEHLVIVGVNGCGKTTLLRLLDGLVFPAEGRVRYAGDPLDARALDDPQFRRRFRREVGLVFQNVDAMLFNPTVADEIAFGPRQLGLDDIDDRVHSVADTLGLTPLFARSPFELSGGEKKRVAVAAVLAVEPRVLLLDEVTAHLDPAWTAVLVELLAGRPGLTVIAATHNLSMAEELGERAILLSRERHRPIFDGPPARLLADEGLLIESGLVHRHVHRHGRAAHTHYHLHDSE